jgi:hypothetical protein
VSGAEEGEGADKDTAESEAVLESGEGVEYVALEGACLGGWNL